MAKITEEKKNPKKLDSLDQSKVDDKPNGWLKAKVYFLRAIIIFEAILVIVALFSNVILATIIFTFFALMDAMIFTTIARPSIFKDLGTIIIFVLVLSAPMTYGIVFYVKSVIIPIYPTFPIISDSSTWIGFAGTIYGGILTMLAVVFTIRNENNLRRQEAKQRAIEFALQSIPVLIIENNDILNTRFRKSVVTRIGSTDDSGFLTKFEINLRISNRSNFIAKSLKFTSFEIYGANKILNCEKDIKSRINVVDIANKELSQISAIPGDYYEDLKISFEMNSLKYKSFTFEMKMSYYDYLDKIEHKIESVMIYAIDMKPRRTPPDIVEQLISVNFYESKARFVK